MLSSNKSMPGSLMRQFLKAFRCHHSSPDCGGGVACRVCRPPAWPRVTRVGNLVPHRVDLVPEKVFISPLLFIATFGGALPDTSAAVQETMPQVPEADKQTFIQRLSRPKTALLQCSNGNWYFHNGTAAGKKFAESVTKRVRSWNSF